MKKILAFVLTLTLVLGLGGITAFAEPTEQNPIEALGNYSTAQVKGTYSSADKVDVYSVDITWGAMAFDFNAATERWDTDSHQWVTDTEAGWEVKAIGGDVITVTNDSSKAVTASFAFAADAACPDVTYSFVGTGLDENALTLLMAEPNTAATPYTVTFVPGGILPDTHTDGAAFGTITVTIN